MFKSTGTCTTNQYIKQINADGSVICGNVPYHWGVTCSAGQYIERIASNGTPTCKTVANPVENLNCGTGQFLYRHHNGTLYCRSFAETDPKIGTLNEGKICRASKGKIACDQNPGGITATLKRYSAAGIKEGGNPIDVSLGTYDFCALAEVRSFDNSSSSGTGTEGCRLTKSGSTWGLIGREADPTQTIYCGAICFTFN